MSMRNFDGSFWLLSALVLLTSCRGDPASHHSLGGGVSGDSPSSAREIEGGTAQSAFPVLPENVVVLRTGSFSAEAENRPWSGWWWPSNDARILKSLEKWDRARNRLRTTSLAAQFEEDELLDASALPWEGHCDAWAMAAIATQEPTVPVSWGGETFSVADQKALLVKAFEKVSGKTVVGSPFRGDRLSDYSEISPVAFHRVLQSELFEKERPFVLDKDPGIPVWNTPIWKAEVKVSMIQADEWLVTTWLWGADPWVEDLSGLGTRVIQLGYVYRLRGTPLPDGSLAVNEGEWVADEIGLIDSRVDHPDFVVLIPSPGEYQAESRNIWIDSALVRDLFAPDSRGLNASFSASSFIEE